MTKTRTRDRLDNSVNAGSMADIAFLLLIFFLVTTTIVEDKGILVKLPPWNPDEPITDVNSKNVLTVLVNQDNDVFAENNPIEANELKDITKTFILNPHKDINKPSDPQKAVVSITNDIGTSYWKYIEVYNEIKAAYNELWDELSEKTFDKAYAHCTKAERIQIKKIIPLVISEAEPSQFGDG